MTTNTTYQWYLANAIARQSKVLNKLLFAAVILTTFVVLPTQSYSQCAGDVTAPTVSTKNVTVVLDANGQATIAEPAKTIFTEDFSSDGNNTYYSYQSITNWNILGSGIDLGDFTTVISGKEIDLSAFYNGGVESKTTFSFSPGTYTLSFDQVRNTTDDPFTVYIGSFASRTFYSTSTMKSETFTFTVTSSTTGKLKFVQGGTNDANGTFVGNIKLAKKEYYTIDNGSTDNCEISTISVSQKNFTCAHIGSNTVTLTVKDANGNQASNTATVTVKPRPTPVAVNDTFTNQGCKPITFTDAQLLGNDYDPENQTIKVSAVINNGSGTLVDNNNGTYTYTPANNQDHTVSLSYIVKRDDGTIVFADNGHFYEFVSAADIDWTDAKTAASNKTYQGRQGYLATITSSAENTFATNKLSGQGWMGASDAASEGTWRWVTGPEAGTQFWSGLSNGSSVNSMYENWASGEPNNFTGFGYSQEHYAHFYSNGTWNDYPNNPPTGWIQGYLVEYGGMPGDCDMASTATGTIIIHFDDNIAPALKVKNITVSLDNNGEAAIDADDIDNGSSDNCGYELTLSRDSFNCSDVGNTTIISRVSDANWKQSTVNLTTPSTFVSVAGSLPAANTYTVSVQNVFPYNGTLIFSPHVPDTKPIYSSGGTKFYKTNFNLTGQPVSLRIRARVDNYMEIFVNGQSIGFEGTLDTKNFTNTAYHDVYIDGNGVQNGYNGGMSFDNVTSQNILSLLHAGDNELVFAIGNTNGTDQGGFEVRLDAEAGGVPVVVTAKDPSGNTSKDTAYVLVQDKLAPSVSVKDITVELDANGSATITASDVDNGSSDNCNLTLSIDKNKFNCSNVGTSSLVKLTAKDGSGNTASATAKVTVVDYIKPTVVTKNVTLYLDASGNASTTASAVNNGSSDNCGIASYSLSKTDFTCANVGDNTVTLTVTDVNGNSNSATTTVTVKDNIKPTVATQNVTLYLDASGNASTTASAVNNGSSDNCSIASYSLSKTDFTCANVGDNTVTLTVTDVNGNSNSETATVTVKDNIKPTVATQNVTLYLDASGNASTTASAVNNGSSDNCSIASYSLSKTDFTCANVGDNTVTLTVTDVNGNSNSATATVTVKDNIKPTVATQNVTLYLDASGNASTSASAIDNGSSDNCSIASYSLSKTDFTCADLGDNTVTLTVTDVNGNENTADATVTVIDNIAPSIATQDISVTLSTSGTASISASDINNGSTDNCSIVSYSLDNSSFDCGDVGENTVTLTIKDASGNTSSATAKVTVKTTLTADAGADKQVYYGYTPMASATLTGSGANGGGTYTYKWSTGATTSSITVSPSSTTTYTLTVTDNNGCTATDDVAVNVEDVRCGHNMDKVIVCHKGSEICIASSGVKAHLDHGCMVGTCKSSKKNGEEGIVEEHDDELNVPFTLFNAYPNPFTNSATVEFTVNGSQQISLELYDVQGRKVQNIYTGSAKENVLYKFSINGKNLPADVYFVRLVADDKVQNLRLVLVK